MKKKGGSSRTKSYDNGKDGSRSHRHSKRRKKSTSSDSDSSSEVESRKEERSDRRKRTRDRSSNKSKNELGSVKSTRHSRRLAVSDDPKEIANEIPTHVTLKLTKSGSSRETSREPKKKDSPSTSDGARQKSKDGNVWKVKSSNGSGGELQKLKICRQRTAEDDEVNNHEDTSAVVNDEGITCKVEESDIIEKSAESVQSVIEKVAEEDRAAQIIQDEHNEGGMSADIKDKEETSSEEVDRIQQDASPIIGETSPAKRYETETDSEAIVATSEQELEDKRLVAEELPLSTDQSLDTLNIEDNVVKEDEEEEKQESTTEEQNQPQLEVGVEGIIGDIQLEEYDYENDEIREEGEVSTQDDSTGSPAYQAYHKIPAEDRKRSWGVCNIFQFAVATVECSEKLLKIHEIKKKIITRMDSSSLTLSEEEKPKEERQSVRTVRKKISSPPADYSEGHKPKKSDISEHKEYGRYRKEEDEHGGRTVLYITNLVRPFTLTQLRELLQRTGKIVDDGFWIDAIKSKCYVQYETPDQAFETKHALDGTRWPANNPKVLCVRYSTQDDLLKVQTQTEVSEIPRKTEPLQLRDERVVNWKHFEERPRKVTVNVREWDIGKPAYPDEMIVSDITADRNVKRRDTNDNRDLNKRSYKAIAQSPKKENTEPEVKKVRKIKEKTQSKQLDDLFIRTKALPSIYWLPLTPSQVAEKEGKHRTVESGKDKGRSINKENINCDIRKEEDKNN